MTTTQRGLGLLLLCTLGLAIALRGAAFGLESAQALLAAVRTKLDPASLLVLTLLYAATLALPFVPGMELGVLIMMTLGPLGVALVYAASLLGLSVSFGVGCWVPLKWAPPRLRNGATTARQSDTSKQLLTLINERRPIRWLTAQHVVWLANHRYLALAICLNLPGNTLVGGGGGIALLCGLSGQYRFHRFFVAAALAIAPLPILTLMGPAITRLVSHLAL